MALPSADKAYKEFLFEIENDPNVMAFWLDGSRGKGMVTENSDYDGWLIVKDEVVKEYQQKYEIELNKQHPEISFSANTINFMKKFSNYGSAWAWNRYNFAHLKVHFDRSDKLQEIIDAKSRISKEEKDQIIKDSLGGFINLIFRLEKNSRDGNLAAAKLEAVETIPYFLDGIFALENKLRPYNKYLEWELDNFPLTKFPWDKGGLISKLLLIVEENQIHIPLELLNTIRPIFKKEGYGHEFEGWKNYYKVGEII